MSIEYLTEPLYGEYCLVTGGRCAHFPVNLIPNSFFVAEPYDSDQKDREKAIRKSLSGFKVIIAEEDVMNIALTCKICHEIQSAQFGIVDITGFNENVLIELGMLYGFNKPVVILVKDTEKIKIEIPSNIIGIEQIRYKDFNELSSKLENVLEKLLTVWKKKGEFILSLKPMLKIYLSQLELAVQTKALIEKGVECEIVASSKMGEHGFIVINKGHSHNIKKNMIFDVYRCDKMLGTDYLEEKIGKLWVFHVQPKLSQALPISHNPKDNFWKDAFDKKTFQRNIVRPFLQDEYLRMSEDELNEKSEILRRILKHI
jgi:hypothetical protein